jgi:hypothetical protein
VRSSCYACACAANYFGGGASVPWQRTRAQQDRRRRSHRFESNPESPEPCWAGWLNRMGELLQPAGGCGKTRASTAGGRWRSLGRWPPARWAEATGDSLSTDCVFGKIAFLIRRVSVGKTVSTKLPLIIICQFLCKLLYNDWESTMVPLGTFCHLFNCQRLGHNGNWSFILLTQRDQVSWGLFRSAHMRPLRVYASVAEDGIYLRYGELIA